MELPYKSYITEADLLSLKGYKLSQILKIDHSGNSTQTVEHWLLEIASIVYNCVLEICNRQDYAEYICTNEEYKNVIARCQLEQAVYVIENGNLLSISGQGETMDLKEMRKIRAYAPLMLNELRAARLVYGGVF